MIRTRDYLSWSQYSLFHSSKKGFWRQYGPEGKRAHSRFFDKGKELSERLEYGTESNDPMLEKVIEALPMLDVPELEIRVAVAEGEDILSYLDHAPADLNEGIFYEYKTGKVAWTKEKVNEHKQLDFYALAYYLKTGIIPKAKLVWVETEETDDGLMFTGGIEEFDREFTKKDIDDMHASILTTIQEIDEFEYTELDIENDFVERYIELLAKKKAIDEELGIMKLEVHTKLDEEKLTYATSDLGKFSLVTKNTYQYSDKLIENEKEIKKKITAAKKAEVKDGIAVSKTTQYLTFKANN